MEKLLPLSELIRQTIEEMRRLNYAEGSITEHRYRCNKILAYAKQISETVFSERLGAQFLHDVYDYPSDVPVKQMRSSAQSAVRAVRRLGDYQLYGAFVRNRKTKDSFDWSNGDRRIIEAYVDSVQTADNRDATKVLRIHHVKLFYDFLGFRKVNGINDVTAKTISDYVLSLQGGSLVYAKHRLATLRYYFRFLYRNGYCGMDLSRAVPSVKAPKNANVPALWSKEELETLLKSVDRGSPIGKRDYAMLLMVIQLGLRVTDIAELKFESLKWERKEITITQHKTGKTIICPMSDEVGWALIDYIRFSRVKSDLPFVFLTVNAPYVKMRGSSISDILKRNMRRAGIQKRVGIASGMHSLRHALARSLLEQNLPLELISDIMGHTSVTSASPYLKIDIEGLRECALSLEEVWRYV